MVTGGSESPPEYIQLNYTRRLAALYKMGSSETENTGETTEKRQNPKKNTYSLTSRRKALREQPAGAAGQEQPRPPCEERRFESSRQVPYLGTAASQRAMPRPARAGRSRACTIATEMQATRTAPTPPRAMSNALRIHLRARVEAAAAARLGAARSSTSRRPPESS